MLRQKEEYRNCIDRFRPLRRQSLGPRPRRPHSAWFTSCYNIHFFFFETNPLYLSTLSYSDRVVYVHSEKQRKRECTPRDDDVQSSQMHESMYDTLLERYLAGNDGVLPLLQSSFRAAGPCGAKDVNISVGHNCPSCNRIVLRCDSCDLLLVGDPSHPLSKCICGNVRLRRLWANWLLLA
jgi:hypothetical protein